MAISDTITSMYENVGNVYDVLELAGADLTNVDKNIENLKQSWEERLLYFLANGTDIVWNNWLPKVNGTGETITLNNTIQAKMDFVYKGNTSQNGEPTPDTPIPVNVVTGDNEVKVEGKNLVNVVSTNEITYSGYGNFTLNNGVITTSGITLTGFKVKVEPNTQYTAQVYTKGTGGTKALRLREYSAEPTSWGSNYIQQTQESLSANAKTTKIITTSANTQWLLFSIYCDASGLIFNNMQLEKSSTATEYEEHKEQTYPINLGSMELCKIGDYQDYIAKSTGKNLFDISKLNSTNLTNAIIGSNTITLTGTNDYHSTVIGTNLGDIADLEIGKTYTLTFDTTYTGNNKNKIFLRGSQSYWESGTSLTITQEMLNDRFAFYGTNNAVVSNIMIRLSSISDTSYEPYGKVWYKYGAIEKVIYTGANDESWNAQTSGIYYRFYDIKSNLYYQDSTARETNIKSNYFHISTIDDYGIMFTYRDRIYLYPSDTSITTENDFKTWLSTHNTTVYYVLNTPTITEITDTTLLNQLEAIKLSYNEQTNISQTNDDKPFILDVVALGELEI